MKPAICSTVDPASRHLIGVVMDTRRVSMRGKLVSMKDAGIRIRVERNLRSAFAAACQAENKQASDVLRDFMQSYAARFQGGQGDLFSERRDEVGSPSAGPRAPLT